MKAEVRNLEEKFHWRMITGNEASLNRPITLPDINRPGLELAGYFNNSQVKRLVVIGGKESRYIADEMDEINQRRVFEFLTNEKHPASSSRTASPVRQFLKKSQTARIFRFL